MPVSVCTYSPDCLLPRRIHLNIYHEKKESNPTKAGDAETGHCRPYTTTTCLPERRRCYSAYKAGNLRIVYFSGHMHYVPDYYSVIHVINEMEPRLIRRGFFMLPEEWPLLDFHGAHFIICVGR